MTALLPAAIGERVRATCPPVEQRATDNGQPFLLVPPDHLLSVLRLLRDDAALRFDALMDLTGYDLLKYPATSTTPASDAIAVVYLLWSHVHKHKVTVKVMAPRAACRVPTASSVWPAALYFEREVWDLLGVHFDGHPSLLRIMCPQDWTGHALRKDYVYPDDYHGVAHLRDGQFFEHAPNRASKPAGTPPATPATKAQP